MRRIVALLAVVIPVVCPAAWGQAGAKKARQTPRSPVQNPPARQMPRIPIPGVGGAIPPRRKPPQINPQQLLPGLGPFQTGKQPAAVLGPGQNPPLPGFAGLGTRPLNDLIFGLNVAWGDDGTLARWEKDGGAKARRLAQLVRASGAKDIRIGLRWADIEPARGRFQWADTDHFLRYVSGLGLPLIAEVGGAPAWSGAHGEGPPSSSHYADLGRFALALAQRYRAHIHYWEFWNEPDRTITSASSVDTATGAPDARLYADLLRVFTTAVRHADNTAQVAVGALTAVNTDYLAAVYRAGAGPYFDAVAFHPHADREGLPFAWIDDCHNLMVHNGDLRKSIWISEWGWETAPARPDAITELHQARLVRQTLAAMRDRSFITVACYDALNDWRVKESDASTIVAAGLSDLRMSPRPAFAAFREMATGANPEATARYARIDLIGALPTVEEGGVLPNAINVDVDAAKAEGPVNPIWRDFAQGYEPGVPDLPNTLSAPLRQLRARIVRIDPFPTGDAFRPPAGAVTASITQTADLANIDWRYADAMIDSIVRAGAAPMIDFATMPSALSSSSGNPRMPRDLAEWAGFVQAVVRRYNIEQKRGIAYWELSNEPDRGDFALSEWMRLYETFAQAVKAVDPTAKVGGPAASSLNEEWMQGLLDDCSRNNIPLQFLSWHAYDLAPAEVGRQIARARGWLQQRPSMQNAELIISEWNRSARAAPENDTREAASFAASVVEQLSPQPSVRALFYEVREGPDPRRPGELLSGRWGIVTSAGRPKPVYQLFRLLDKLEGQRVSAGSDDTAIHAMAARESGRVGVLLWRDAPAPKGKSQDLPVHLRLHGLPWGGATVGEEWSIDERHSGPMEASSGHDAAPVACFDVGAGDLEVPLVLARGSIAFVQLQPGRPGPISVRAQSPRYLVYGGTPFNIIATVKNVGSRPEKVLASLNAAEFGARRESKAVSLNPGESRAVVFSVMPPAGAPEGPRFLGVTATAGPTTARSDLGVKLVAALQARLEASRVEVSSPPVQGVMPVARVKVLVENRSDAPIRAGVIAGKSSSSIMVPPHQVAPVPVVVAAASDRPGVYADIVKVVRTDGSVVALPVSVGVPALSPLANTPPRINADLTEWADVPRIPLSPVLAERRGSVSSMEAQAATMWDREHLYIALVVTDNDTSRASEPTSADRAPVQAEILFEPASAGLPVRYLMDLDRVGPRLVQAATANRPVGPVVGARVAGRHEGLRTLYEVSIPWSQIPGGMPLAGEGLRFGVVVRDTRGLARPSLSIGGGDPTDAATLVGLRLQRSQIDAPAGRREGVKPRS